MDLKLSIAAINPPVSLLNTSFESREIEAQQGRKYRRDDQEKNSVIHIFFFKLQKKLTIMIE